MNSWKLKEFNRWISDGCPENHTVKLLDLGNNQLSSLPESIGNLTALKHLYLMQNRVRHSGLANIEAK